MGGTIPEDAALLGLYLLGVPRTSAHPNLAKLYIETVLSEEGQRFLYQSQLIDHAELPGSQSAAAVNEVKSRGATFLKVNVPFLTQYTDQAKLKEDLIAILRSKQPS